MKPLRSKLGLITLALLLGACATTHLMREWRNSSYTGPPFKKVAIMTLSEDVTIRRVYEDVFAQQLAKRGINVRTSYATIPTPKAMECEKVERMVCDIGSEAVLVTRILSRETRYEIMQMDQPTMFRGYLTSYSVEQTPIRYDVMTLEAKLFRMTDGTLVWSGITETLDRPDIKDESREFVQRVIQALVKEKLL